MRKQTDRQPDWNALCNHPGVIFVQRIVLTVSVALGVPAVLWLASTFIDMRDAMRDASKVMALTEKVLDDHENRLRELEFHGAPRSGDR